MVLAFGALYVGVNDYESKIPSGLYRITSSNGDDQLDKVGTAPRHAGQGRSRRSRGAPHARRQGAVSGRAATAPSRRDSAHLARAARSGARTTCCPRMPDGRGFMRDVLAPGGIIYRVSPDGKEFEVVASGFRNIFDAAFNRDGELFTYDADMEYDFNTSVVPAHPHQPRGQRRGVRLAQRRGQATGVLSRQPAGHAQRRPRLADRHDLRLRGEVPREVSERAVRPRLELGQALRLPPRARRRDLQGDEGGVPQRLAAAADRRDHQSRTTARCISPSAAARCSRACIA